MDYPLDYIMDVLDELRDLQILSEPELARVAHQLCD